MNYPWLTLTPERLIRDSRLQAFQVAGDYNADSAEFIADVADLIADGAARVSVHLRNQLRQIAGNLSWPFADAQWQTAFPNLDAAERTQRGDEQAKLANAATKDFALAALRRNLSGDENARVALALEQSGKSLLDELTGSVTETATAFANAGATRSASVGAIGTGHGDSRRFGWAGGVVGLDVDAWGEPLPRPPLL